MRAQYWAPRGIHCVPLRYHHKDNYGLMPLLATSEFVKGFTEKWGSGDIFYLTRVIRLYVPHLSKV